MSEPRRHIHVYRRLIRLLLPPGLRIEAEAELVETFSEAHARLAHRGAPARAGFWIGTLLDLLWTGISERINRQGGWLLDLRQVLRGLAASRSYTAVAILSLAIGIGANASVFSVIRALLLDPVDVPAPGQLTLVYWSHPGDMTISQMNSSAHRDPGTGQQFASNYSYPLYEAVRASAPAGVDMAGFNFIRDVALQYGHEPAAAVGGLLADGAFFGVVGPRIAHGRPLTPNDDRDGAEPAAVLSHRLWMRTFGGDPAIVGAIVRVNGVPTRIVGITAAGFRGLSKGGFFPQTEITLPLRLAPLYYPRWAPDTGSLFAADEVFWLRVIARVPDGVSRDVVAARLAQPITPVLTPMLTSHREQPASVTLVDGSRGLDQTRPETRRMLYILMGVVGIVLAIACINVASLMLARGVSRQREMALRRALGAGRARLARVLVLEAVVLAIGGGVGGLLLTWWSRAALTTLLTAGIGTESLSTQPGEVAVDVRLMALTFGLSFAAALLFSLIPAWRLTGDKGTANLRQQVIGSRTPKLLAGRALVALQIAVTLPLITGAVLFLRTMSHLGGVELGFDPAGIVYFKVDPAVAGLPESQHSAVYLRLVEQLRAVPGVTSATLVENALLSGWTSNAIAAVDGKTHNLFRNAVGPDFIETMGMRLLAGRAPGVQDMAGGPLVAAVNQRAARRLFGEASPVGRHVTIGSGTVEIVGVVSDSLYDRQRAAVRPTLFDSALQRGGYGGHHVVVRSALPVDRIEPALRAAVAAVHRNLPVPAFKTQIAQMQDGTIRERVFTQLLSLFGVFTLLLASIGLYGVTAYSVRRRTSEIGVRMALGAERRHVVWMIERQVVVLVLFGLAAGIPLALMAAPLVQSLLFGVAPRDLTVIAVASAALLITAVAAGLLPARRAASIDPLRALRAD